LRRCFCATRVSRAGKRLPRARHIELNSEPDFNARFVEALRLA